MRSQPCVLTADLNGDCPALCRIHACHSADQIPGCIAQCVMQGNHQKNHQPGCKELVSVVAHDAADDAGEPDHADRRHDLHRLAIGFLCTEGKIQECTRRNRNQGHDQNAPEHTPGIDMNRLTRQPIHQQGRHDRSQQSTCRRHADAERDIPFRQIAHDIAGHSARACSHEQEPDRDSFRKMKEMHQSPCQQRHQCILSACPDENVQRTLCQNPEIVLCQRHSHREHDDSEDNGL